MFGSGPSTQRHRSTRRGLGALGTAVAATLAAPAFGVWPLAFVCLVPLLLAFRGSGPLARAGTGALALAALALGLTTPWLGGALAAYLEVAAWRGALAGAAIALLVGGSTGAVFGALAGDPLRHAPVSFALRVGSAWVAGEAFRAIALGLPWLELSHLLAPVPALAQHAAVGGARLVSFWLACTSAAGLALVLRTQPRTALALLGAVAGVGLASAACMPRDSPGRAGSVTLAAESAPGGAVRVALVQPALESQQRLDRERVPETLGRLVELTRGAGGADLVVWPENALPVFLPANEALLLQHLAPLQTEGAAVLLGAPRADATGAFFNSAFLYRSGGLAFVHDKVRRVPFTEYTPRLVGAWYRAPVELTRGARAEPLRTGHAMLGPLICYELLFPDVARAHVRAGADLLVNLSHDGYFGEGAGAPQHLSAAPLRAIELRRPLLRATSDGLTVAIDAAGSIAARLEPGRPGVLRVDVWPGRGQTPFARFGDWVSLLAAVFAVTWLVWDLLRGRER